MSYALPDEPKGAVRPDLAVSALWPLLTLMLVGPLLGFAWIAFNSWALGCRHAARHTVIASLTVPVIGILTLIFAASALSNGGATANGVDLVLRLQLIATQTIGLCLAFWMMWDQDQAEQWRKTFGPPLRNGAAVFFGLFIARLFLGASVPGVLYVFLFWTNA